MTRTPPCEAPRHGTRGSAERVDSGALASRLRLRFPLTQLPDGRILYRLRHRWRDGTTHVVFEPLDLVARLAALVPPPQANTVRNHGVLAPCAGWRDVVVRDR